MILWNYLLFNYCRHSDWPVWLWSLELHCWSRSETTRPLLSPCCCTKPWCGHLQGMHQVRYGLKSTFMVRWVYIKGGPYCLSVFSSIDKTKTVHVFCENFDKKIEKNLYASKSGMGPMVGHSTSVLSQPFFFSLWVTLYAKWKILVCWFIIYKDLRNLTFRSREIAQKPFKTRQGTKIAKKVLFFDKKRTDQCQFT